MQDIDSINDLKNQASYLKGTCLTMCPYKEVQLRMKGNLIHKLETIVNREGQRTEYADTKRMVKEFSRSFAGREILPSDVRPLPILIKTVKYLLLVVCSYEDVSWREIYDFVNDRLRAVRQDVIVQGYSGKDVINMFAPIARFYVYSHYRLCDHECSEFDHYLNLQQLREVLLTLLPVCREDANEPCSPNSDPKLNVNWSPEEISEGDDDADSCSEAASDDCRYAPHSNDSEEERALVNSVNLLDLQHEHKQVKEFKEKKCPLATLSVYEEMTALHLLINIGRPEVISDVLYLPDSIRKNPFLLKVINASIKWMQGNQIPLIRLSSILPPILASALHMRLNEVQRTVLGVSSVAYSSNVLNYNIDDLQERLLFSSKESLQKACHYYGLSTSSEGVQFLKSNFKWDVPVHPPEKAEWVENKLSGLAISDLLMS